MRHIAPIMLATGLAIAYLGGCATIQATLGPTTTTTVRNAALDAMQTYKNVWVPLLNMYGSEPACGASGAFGAPFCQDPKLYRKLYDADGAIATCAVAATAQLNATNTDTTKVSACLAQIGLQQAAIAQAAPTTVPAS